MRAKWGPFYMIWHAWKHKWSHEHGTMEFNVAYDSVQIDQKSLPRSHGHPVAIFGLFGV